MSLIKPKELIIEDMDGNSITVIMSRFPATIGREIASKYPMANLPKIGDYKVSDETMEKLMGFVGIPQKDNLQPILLKTRALIDNHIPDAETLIKIEMGMLEYNFTFFRKGAISDFFNEFVQTITGKVIAMLTPSSEQSSAQTQQPSTSSEPSTTSKTPLSSGNQS